MQLQYEAHPALKAFPLMTGAAYQHLVEDVRARGLIDDIVRLRNKAAWIIVDGRARMQACVDAGVKPRFVELEDDDVLGFIVAKNLTRRHLNESQRALVAARLSTLERGRPKKTGRSADLSRAQAAHQLNVSERSVGNAKAVLARGVPELAAAVEAGELAVDAAAAAARETPERQRKLAAAAIAGKASRPQLQPDRKRPVSLAMRLSEHDLIALNVLTEVGDAHKDPRARAGAMVVRRIVPMVAAR